VKFTREEISEVTIRNVEPGSIRIGENTYSRNVVLTAGELLDRAIDEELDTLQVEDIDFVLATEPEMVLIGSGWTSMLPPKDLVFALARRGIGLEVMNTPAACRTFNILVNEGRRLAAILKILE
jgi:uncharacterized protein